MNRNCCFTGFTLVDITSTGVIHDREGFEKQRDQQRNWETVLQCLGLRIQPMNIQGPKVKKVQLDGELFGELYQGIHNVWIFTFTIEREGIWEVEGDNMALLNSDFNQVPIIQGLNETARFILPIFYTSGGIKNIFFRNGLIDLNTI